MSNSKKSNSKKSIPDDIEWDKILKEPKSITTGTFDFGSANPVFDYEGLVIRVIIAGVVFSPVPDVPNNFVMKDSETRRIHNDLNSYFKSLGNFVEYYRHSYILVVSKKSYVLDVVDGTLMLIPHVIWKAKSVDEYSSDEDV